LFEKNPEVLSLAVFKQMQFAVVVTPFCREWAKPALLAML